MSDVLPTKRSPEDEGRCYECGGPLTEGQQRRQDFRTEQDHKLMDEMDSTYRHLRAVIENCKHSPVEAIRHQLVGLLPETREMDPDLVKRLREKNMGHLADRHAQGVQEAWAEYGYGGGPT